MRILRICGHTFISDTLSPNSVVLDFGMNRGAFSTTVSQLFNCRLFGAEADPRLYASLPRIAKLQALNVAVAGESGEVQLSVYQNHCASVVFGGLEPAPETFTVPTMNLGGFLKLVDRDRVALLKCDIEGAELQMLESASDEELQRLDQISIEFHDFLDQQQRPRVDQVVARLRALSFWPLDFSLNRMDVLMINQSTLPLNMLNKAQLVSTKLSRGVSRVLRRPFGYVDTGDDGF